MIAVLKGCRVFYTGGEGRREELGYEKDGRFSTDGVGATVFSRRVAGCTVIAAGARRSSGTFDPENALSVVFPDKKRAFVADAMRGEFWCEPSFGERFSQVPERTQMLLFKDKNLWRLYWPLCGSAYTSSLAGVPEGLELRIFSLASGLSEVGVEPYLLCAGGRDPFLLVKKAARAIEKITCGRVLTSEKKKYPDIFEYLGWCSWDALQIRVSEKGLVEKAREFKDKKIPVRWCIIDDMWGHVRGLNELPPDIGFNDMVKAMHRSSLYRLGADPERFPNGLSGAVSALHDEGLGVGVWYPATGYWRGIDPDGPLAEELRDILVRLPDGRLVPEPVPGKIEKWHAAMQDLIASAGADFVKVDNQSHYRNFFKGYVYPVGEAAGAEMRAIEKCARERFGGAIINCMGMTNECMQNRATGSVCRCSNDFLPENRPWFARHILQCSFNSLFQGQFHRCDWDMWWTDDAQAEKNAICRAISGGPVYVSDRIGRSRPEILKPLVFSDGRILRADGQAVPTADCLLSDPRTSSAPLKIFNRAGNCGAVAVFNISSDGRRQTGTLSPSDAGLPGGRYLVLEQLSGDSFLLEKGESIGLKLRDNDDFRLYLFYPAERERFALGLVDKRLAPKSVLNETGSGCSLYEGGLLGLYGVPEIKTDLRERVRGEKQGEIFLFRLEKEEKEIYYL